MVLLGIVTGTLDQMVRGQTVFRTALRDWLVIALVVIGSFVWVYQCGPDLSADLLRSNLYTAYQFVHGRLAEDIAPVNYNPLVFVPFYAMVMANWPSLVIAGVLTLFHSLNVVFAYFLARKVLNRGGEERWESVYLATALVGLCPMYLSLVGTAFGDVASSVFVMLGVLLALDAGQPSHWWCNRGLLAGLAVGVAAGLRTNDLIYGPALVLMVLALPLRERLKAFCWVVLGGAGGWLLVHGYWSWHYWSWRLSAEPVGGGAPEHWFWRFLAAFDAQAPSTVSSTPYGAGSRHQLL